MANLYELMGDYEALQQALEEEELTNEQLQKLLDELDDMKGSLKEKVDNIAKLVANLDADIHRFRTEEQRLEKRRKAIENKKKRLRAWVRTSMDILDVKRIKTNVHSVTLSEAQDKVVVLDIKQVPEEYLRRKPEVDKKKVMRAYEEDGEIVAGCDIKKGDPVLTIR